MSAFPPAVIVLRVYCIDSFCINSYCLCVRRAAFLLLTFCLFGFSLHAESLLLSDETLTYDLSSQLRFYIDPHQDLSTEEAYRIREDFKAFPEESVQIPREGVMWLLLSVDNRSSYKDWIIENAMMIELMELHVREAGQWRIIQRSGNMIPFSRRDINTRTPAFHVTIPPGASEEILIRVFDYQSASVRLQLSEQEAFWDQYLQDTLLLGLAFGFFAALVVYNFVIFLFNRDLAFLFYSLYMAAFFFNQFAQERLFSQFITPDQPYGFFWFIIFGGATAAFGLEFFRRFIETRSSMPRVDRLMRTIRMLAVMLIISGFFYAGPVSADILNVLSLLAMGLIMYALVVRIFQRDILALVCLLGSLLYLVGTAAEIWVTLVPAPVTPLIINAQLYGALLQVLFLGFALGAKSLRLRRMYTRMQQRYQNDLERRVAERTRELEEANQKLAKYAITDALTGLFNRKELQRRMAELDPYLARKGGDSGDYVLSVAYIDLDNFKSYNDTFGHGRGDQLLQQTAEILRSNTRPYDLLFRIGGDEFLVIMPDADLDTASQIVERFRLSFEATFSPETRVSASIGVSSSASLPGAKLDALIQAADSALLLSKEIGKNCISFQ